MHVRAVGHTDVGRVREENQDSYLIVAENNLFVVADGMGGHLGGKMASTIAVDTIGEVVAATLSEMIAGYDTIPFEDSPTPRLLADAVRAACAAIYRTSREDPALQGMGTTVVAMFVVKDHAFVAHVGDSRCYLQRGDRVAQITDDHSLVNEQIKAGLITEEEARTSQLKNIITRSVGFEPDVAVDTFSVKLETGDHFLICSDGLTGFVDDTEIGLALATTEFDSVPHRMIDVANSRGGDDNITALCVEILDGEAAPVTAAAAAAAADTDAAAANIDVAESTF